jgi:hypothetical protein
MVERIKQAPSSFAELDIHLLSSKSSASHLKTVFRPHIRLNALFQIFDPPQADPQFKLFSIAPPSEGHAFPEGHAFRRAGTEF